MKMSLKIWFHEFSMLFIGHLLNIIMNATIVEASLVRSKNGDVVIYTPIIDYSNCPNSLEHVSFYEFTSTYTNNFSIKQFQFKSSHLQHVFHALNVQTLKHISMSLKLNYRIYHKTT